MQALARWWHLVASSEAWDVLALAMCPALYRRVCMVIKKASNFPTFFIVVNSVVVNNLR